MFTLASRSVSVPPAWAAQPADYAERTNPALLTRLLLEAVPILRFLGFSVVSTEPGACECRLPLTIAGSNQHGVHQAAVLGIAADYAGGIALGSLCHGAPIIGVHPQVDDDGAALWAVSLRLDYKLPSSSDVRLTATVPAGEREAVRHRYNSGRMVLKEIGIVLEGEGGIFATANVTYFIQKARSLRPKSAEARPNAMFTHKHKASARFIAALRDKESSRPGARFIDPFARDAAGPHGALLAERFLQHSPQLSEMVAQRTLSADDVVRQVAGLAQLVLIGAGYDFRHQRLGALLGEATVFEVDLAELLEWRAELHDQFGLDRRRQVAVPLNLELHDLERELCAKGFDPSLPTVFILEGTSMYLSDQAVRRILGAVRRLMRNGSSRLWMDYVTASVARGEIAIPAVQQFLRGIHQIGEPFIWGIEGASDFFGQLGLSVDSDRPSDYLSPSDDPVFDVYRFAVVGPTTHDR